MEHLHEYISVDKNANLYLLSQDSEEYNLDTGTTHFHLITYNTSTYFHTSILYSSSTPSNKILLKVALNTITPYSL